MLKQFKFRSFISISALLFFILMGISGVAAYIKPEGSVASWQAWTFLGLDKGEWEGLHTLAGIFFLCLSIAHIILNWKILCQYIEQRCFLNTELILGVLFLLFVTGSSILRIPPLSLLMDAGEQISDSWAITGSPPFDRAERETLLELCAKPEAGVTLATAMKRLEDAGIKSVEPSRTLEELAIDNDTSPAELWEVIGN